MVMRLDRLARSVADLCAIENHITGKGAALRINNMELDTSTPTGKLMLNVLGSIAQFEREIVLEHQREGIAKAKVRPVHWPATHGAAPQRNNRAGCEPNPAADPS